MAPINAYFDGACWPINPGGNLAYGFYFEDQSGELCYAAGDLYEWADPKQGSNNVAEYYAAFSLLKTLVELELQNEKIIIHGDSKLVTNQLAGNWKIKAGAYVAVAHKCLSILTRFSNIAFKWIPREQNAVADYLSKEPLKKLGYIAK